MAYDNRNSGLLARNERKQQPNHPDFTGQCDIDGVQYWISAWTKDGKPGSKMEGKRFFSLSFKPKDEAAKPAAGAASSTPSARPSRQVSTPPPATTPPKQTQSELDEEVPF